jgi:hypothetical protein
LLLEQCLLGSHGLLAPGQLRRHVCALVLLLSGATASLFGIAATFRGLVANLVELMANLLQFTAALLHFFAVALRCILFALGSLDQLRIHLFSLCCHFSPFLS